MLPVRVVWFPTFAVYITFFDGMWPDGWQGDVTHAAVGSCLLALAMLQLLWTWKAVRAKES